MALSKDEILGANDLPTKEIPVPEWGGNVIVRMLTGAEQERLEKDSGKVWINLIVFSCVDDEGKQLFTEKDVAELKKKSAKVILRLSKEIAAFNGMTKEEVKELEKNSESDQSDDSGSS